jgi:polysaccharide chain length determinant protein (PEP-CTERM system associated)
MEIIGCFMEFEFKSEQYKYSEEKIDWQKWLELVRRRRWWFALPVFFVSAIVWGLSWSVPAVYRSETLILVEQQKVPEQYVVPNIGEDLQHRLQSMTQQILSRSRLLRIIDQFRLYEDARRRSNADEVVEQMRKDIQIEVVREPERKETSAFKIAYQSGDPQLAQSVVSQLSSLFIDENLRNRQEQSMDTTKFLDDQLERARATLALQEEKVREFKSRYLGELPGQVQSNVQILAGLQSRRDQETTALAQATQQNVYLQTMLNQFQTAEADARSGASTPPVASSSLDLEIEKAQMQLAELTARYSDEHPDVRKLKNQIARAQKIKQQRSSEFSNIVGSGTTLVGDGRPTNSEPLVITPRIQIESQLKANNLEIQNRRHSIEDADRQIGAYQARLNTSPLREQQLADLTRDYDQTRKNYEALLAKRNQSEMATNLEIRQQGERFRILDPPNLPEKPSSPSRFKIALLGIGAGILLGTISAAASESIDDRVYSGDDLKDIVTAPILVEIPDLPTPIEQQVKANRSVFQTVAMALLFVLILVGLGFNRLFG